MFGQVLWPMNSAMAAPVFESGDGVAQAGSKYQYDVTADRAVANWQSFVLGETEKIEFLNNSAEGKILLNLVNAGTGSKIAGELNAKNIQFILVDPSGINIAGSSKIDVSGLVLSTAGVSVLAQGKFKNDGNLLFDSSSNGKIKLESGANIVSDDLKNVVLIGKNIQNNANIEASGLVAMLATDNATLTLEGSNILGVSFNAESLVDASLVNNGAIVADKAFLANQATNGAIKIDQSITANKIVISGDKIELASSLNGTSPSTSNVNIGKGVTSTSESSQLSAVSELTIGSNSALSGFNDNQSAVKANAVNVKSEAYTKATITNNNKITLDGFSDISDVQSVSFTNNQNNGISTNSLALLTDTKNSLKTRGVTFSGIAAAELGGKALTGSDATDSFVITTEGITANDIAITNLNKTIDANGNAKLSGASDAWQLTENKKELISDGYTFTGLTEASLSNEGLKGSSGNDTLTISNGGLQANNISITKLKNNTVNANGRATLSGADEATWLLTGASGVLKSKETGGYTFTDLTAANLSNEGLKGSVVNDTFKITAADQETGVTASLTANDIIITELNNNTINANGSAKLWGATEAWQLTENKNELISDGYTFIDLSKVSLSNESLKGSTANDTFKITRADQMSAVAGLIANDIIITELKENTVNASGAAILSGASGAWQLTGNKNELAANGYTFTGLAIANLSGESLRGSVGQDGFTITSEGITANDIAVKNLNTTINTNGDVTLSGADKNTWRIHNSKELVATDRQEGGKSYTFTGLDKVTFGDSNAVLNGRGVDTFRFNDNNLLKAANMDFVTNNLRTVNNTNILKTTYDAELLNSEKSLKSNGISFHDVGEVYLGDRTLTGSVTHNRFDLIDTKKVNAADITFVGVGSVIGSSNTATISTTDKVQLLNSDHSFNSHSMKISGAKTVTLKEINGTLTASSSYNSFNLVERNKLTIAGIDFNSVDVVESYNDKGSLTTTAGASLGASTHSLTTHGVTLKGIETVNLSDNALTASTAQNSFNVTGSKALTAADIEFTGVTSVTGDNNLGHVDTNADANLEADKHTLTTQNITFTGINKADLQNNALTASTEQNSFNVTGSKALTVADIDFTEVATVTGNSNQGHVITNADANLEADKHALTTQNITFTGINKADLQNNTLTASTEQNSFSVTGSKALTVADIDFTGVTSVVGDNNLGHVDTNADANLETDKHALTTQGIGFTGIGSMDLNGQSLIGSEHDDSFQILVDGVKANGIKTTNLNRTINANGAVTLSGAQNNIWQLMDMKGELKDSRDNGFIFIGVNAANLQGETLNASAAQNKFDITGAQKLTAADIDFTGVTSVVGDNNQGQVTTNADANLAADKHALTSQNIIFTGINKADLQNNTLTASTAQNSFNVTGSKALTAADIEFTGVTSVAGDNNLGHVDTNANANLEADKHALTTQGIGFTDIGSMDLNGQSLIGSEHDDSFQILVDGVKANGIKTTNLNRTINANGAVTLSGAQNNIWQLMDMKGELKDSRDNGFIFIGVNAANLQGETLNASAAHNKFDITGAQKLTAADINFTGVTSVVGDNNQGQVTTNADANLAADKHALTSQNIIFTGINKADLQNN